MAKLAKLRTKAPRGIGSAAVGLRILKALTHAGKPLHLREIAAAAEVGPSNAYRYLVSFVNAELVVQGDDNRYDLGPFAIQIGLAALSRIDGVDLAIRSLGQVVERTDLDGHISVFGSRGPIVIRWRGRAREVVVRVSEGTILPLLTSATGRVWAAYLHAASCAKILQDEIKRTAGTKKSNREQIRDAYERQLAKLRSEGLFLSHGERRVGIDALSGPVFDRDGSIAFAMTLMGPSGSFDPQHKSSSTGALRQALVELSRKLGAGPDAVARYPWYRDTHRID
jgi:DNA-binding IclR family transcriptional regulator